MKLLKKAGILASCSLRFLGFWISNWLYRRDFPVWKFPKVYLLWEAFRRGKIHADAVQQNYLSFMISTNHFRTKGRYNSSLVCNVFVACVALFVYWFAKILPQGRGTRFLRWKKTILAIHSFKHSVAVSAEAVNTLSISFFCVPVLSNFSVYNEVWFSEGKTSPCFQTSSSCFDAI